MTELSLLDERLAEIDERLRSLQFDLEADEDDAASELPAPVAETPVAAPAPMRAVPGLAPSPVAAPASASVSASAPGEAAETDGVLAQLRELGAAHERLLELHRELLSQYARLLERRAAETASLPLVAGPFTDAETLRSFEAALRELPGVSEVTVREFLGGDRVAVDVRLVRG